MVKQISETLRIEYHEFDRIFWVISDFEKKYDSEDNIGYVIFDGHAETMDEAIQKVKQYFGELFDNL